VVKRYVFNQQAGSPDGERFTAAIDEVVDARLNAKTVPARLRTLSGVIAEQGIDRIDLLKINVEKSELDVLRGIGPADWPKIRQLVIEVDEHKNLEPITSLLEGNGFEIVVEQDPLLTATDLCYVYAIRRSAEACLVRHQPAGAFIRAEVAPDGEVLTPTTLRRELGARLPRYMIPSAFVLMDKLPLTANGKVDRHALPAAVVAADRRPPDVARPLTDTEQALAAIWRDLLKVEHIGIHDRPYFHYFP